MSSHTTYKCDRCGTPSKGDESFESIYYHGNCRHYCDACKPEIVLLLDAKAESSVEAARLAAAAEAVAPLYERIKALEARAAAAADMRVAERKQEREAWARERAGLRATNDTLGAHAAEQEQRARELAKERDSLQKQLEVADAAYRHVIECAVEREDAIDEVVGMLGKKARRRHEARLTEITLRPRISAEGLLPPLPPSDTNPAIVEARRRAREELRAIRDVPGPSFLERHAGDQ